MENTASYKLSRGSDQYPERLEILPDPPEDLYLRGDLPALPAVAIVGSRNADTLSCRFASQLARELVQRNICIISGGAAGIDTAAHWGALEGKGPTIAVIGSGFDYLYPAENRGLFDSISANGALLTEFHYAQPPTRWTFPKRNRIVAALALAVIVVQAGERSGALITARLANEIGVPVGAVPGIAGDLRNRGNHALLRGGAQLIESTQDVLSLISKRPKKEQLHLPGVEIRPNNLSVDNKEIHSPTEVKILDILCARPLHIDEITETTGLLPGETSAAVLALELKGLIQDQGGKHFVRVG